MFEIPHTESKFDAEDPFAHTPNFTTILGFAASTLPDMDEISRTWRYPVDPSTLDVAFQNSLREGRGASRRFVQAAGTLARVLGGQLRTGGDASAVLFRYFPSIQPASNERAVPRHEQFGYDFLKAILLWLDSGLGNVVQGFSGAGGNSRFPIPRDADTDAIDEILIPYLLQLASDKPIVDLEVSRFEANETRLLFESEKAAVTAFSQALRVPFADLSGEEASSPEDTARKEDVQDRASAVRRWAFKVGRGVLFNAAKDIRFSFVGT
jgi:nuclear receptor interaction protein